MKTIIINCTVMILLISTACKKEQEKIIFDIYYSGSTKYGNFTALKNGIKWEAGGLTDYYKEGGVIKEFIGISGYTFFDNDTTNTPYRIETMSISNFPVNVGKYKLRQYNPKGNDFKEGEGVFRYGYYENDAEVNPFELIPEADNFVEVTKIDSLHIEGRFDVTCKGKYKIKGVTHIYRFSEGKFNVLFRK
jgi:hypothetical protein